MEGGIGIWMKIRDGKEADALMRRAVGADVFSGNDPRRNLDVEGYGIVETAMAKWENKSRLAKMDEENCKLIQGTRGYYDCRSLFGET